MDAPMTLMASEATGERRASLRSRMDRFLASVEQPGYRLALAQLRDRDEALDAVQDAMWRLVQKYSRKPEAQWKPLFFRILINRVRDAQRRRAPLTGVAPEVLERPAADDPEAQQAQRDAIRELEVAINELPARQREAVHLRIWEGFDVATTATIMACSTGSVKTHLSRALHRLRSRVEEQWG